MKPCDKMPSLWGANTLIQGQQIKTEHRREITEDGSQKADQQADKCSRSMEVPTQIGEDQTQGDQRTREEESGPLRQAKS
jgi:hypothetical protein